MKIPTELLAQIHSWPADQELADYGHYSLSEDERAAVTEGLAEADRGEFVSEAEIARQDQRHGA